MSPARLEARKDYERQKNAGLLNRKDRCGVGRAIGAGKAEQTKSAVSRSPQLPQWRSIQVAPAFCGRYFRVTDEPGLDVEEKGPRHWTLLREEPMLNRLVAPRLDLTMRLCAMVRN